MTEDLRKAFELLVEEIDRKAKENEDLRLKLLEEKQALVDREHAILAREVAFENRVNVQEANIANREAALGQVRQLAATRKVEIETLREQLAHSEIQKRDLRQQLREAKSDIDAMEKKCFKLLGEKHQAKEDTPGGVQTSTINARGELEVRTDFVPYGQGEVRSVPEAGRLEIRTDGPGLAVSAAVEAPSLWAARQAHKEATATPAVTTASLDRGSWAKCFSCGERYVYNGGAWICPGCDGKRRSKCPDKVAN